MNRLNSLVVQCGAPTAVINMSLASVIRTWQARQVGGSLFGGRFGLQCLISQDWVDLSATPQAMLDRLNTQPGSALGGGRDRLTEAHVPTILAHLQQARIGTLFLIGGNGTMSACYWLSQVSRANGHPLQVIGIPKTIDNDILMVDATPGYGSAALYLAQTVYDAGTDLVSMRGFDAVAIIEAMGRHVGWLTAASALARYSSEAPPHIILLPEVAVDEGQLLSKVSDTLKQQGVCLIVTAESVRDNSGAFLAEREHKAESDASSQKLLAHSGGAAPYLAAMIGRELGVRTRYARPDNLQRNCSTLVSEVDRALANLVGEVAVETALQGIAEVMIAIRRKEELWEPEIVPLTLVGSVDHTLPAAFYDNSTFDVMPAFLQHVRPLADNIVFEPPVHWL